MDEGGVYRVAIHAATGALAGGTGGALGAAATARAAPLLNEMKTSIANSLKEAGASEAVAKAAGQLIAGATATGIGTVAGGGSTAGAAMGLNIDANNRQLHPDEKKVLHDLARAKAEEIAKGSSSATEQAIQAMTERLYTVLADETTALLDAKENKQNGLYRQQLEQTKRPGLEGNFDAGNQLALMDWARGEALAMQQLHAGQTVQLNGRDLIADGSKLQLFQSSTEQYKDNQLFNTVQREVAIKQFAGNADREAAIGLAQDAYREGTAAKVDTLQQQTLERLRATNGAVAMDTTDIDLATLGVGGLAKAGVTKIVEAGTAVVGKTVGAIAEARALSAAEKEAAEVLAKTKIDNNFYAEGASTNPVGLQTSGGIIAPNPDKTTTVLGRWNPDMQSTIEGQMQAVKSEDFGARPGGFNVLNVSKAIEDEAGAQFFEKVNKPFLDEALMRKDDIVLATVPAQKKEIIDLQSGQLLGNYAKELDYLVKNNYKPANITQIKWEEIKGWFQ